MWPLVAALLLWLADYGSFQMLFKKIKDVTLTRCNKTAVIPCFVTNVEAQKFSEVFVKWKYNGSVIFFYDGFLNISRYYFNFTSAKVELMNLLKGDASLHLEKHEALLGNYTCEFSELSREGETIVELKHRSVLWISQNERVLFTAFPILSVILFWGQFCVVSEYPKRASSGVSLFVSSSAMLIAAHCRVLKLVCGITYIAIAILIFQLLGLVLAIVGLILCALACVAIHGPLLISGLGIITLAELFGLIYITFCGPSVLLH
ncbi:leukocyte surface antigen CD47-like isoform X2 [Ochotona curzoniae]|uniref:leukocyte surface antigen CD47-like isoform X2 n=1 Tax=Ochotona curzoniae TaxID=130825 RepID=UPI001B34EF0E|nr:leukocyte surface antigen CD47-like isoform X2 [Ochotona curzoniae]